MEKSTKTVMMPAPFKWSDIGSWDAIAAVLPCDAGGNASRDPLVSIDATRNVVASRGKPVALLGVHDVVVVDSDDALLICARSRAQDVRRVVSELKRRKLEKLR